MGSKADNGVQDIEDGLQKGDSNSVESFVKDSKGEHGKHAPAEKRVAVPYWKLYK